MLSVVHLAWRGRSVDQVQELHQVSLGLGGWGAGAETIFSDVYKVRMATTRELFGQMKSHLRWQRGHHLANFFFFPLSKYKKRENFPVVLGRVALIANDGNKPSVHCIWVTHCLGLRQFLHFVLTGKVERTFPFNSIGSCSLFAYSSNLGVKCDKRFF